MRVKDYAFQYTGDNDGNLTLWIEHEGENYKLEFKFVERTMPPHEDAPFPTGDTKKYAWPSQNVPDDIKFEVGTDKAMEYDSLGVQGVPDGLQLLKKSYNDVENTRKSPFVAYRK